MQLDQILRLTENIYNTKAMFYKNSLQFKYKDVVGSAYHNKGNARAIIYCKGGPSMGDNGQNKLCSELSSKHKISVIIPDYIGSGRSGGDICSIENCCKTVQQCEELLLNNEPFLNCWENKQQQFNVDKILLLAHSWGGTMAALHFKFYPNSKISDIALIAGEMDYDVDGHKKYGGESDAEYWVQMLNGWSNYYRNIATSNWKDLVLGIDRINNPLDNVKVMETKHIYLIHGVYDEVISPQRTKNYFNAIKKVFPAKKDLTIKMYKRSHFNIINPRMFSYLIEKVWGN